jgi:Tfp pilus assembly protein PilO
MKKNFIIAFLAVTTILSVVYAFYQKAEAEKQEELAIQNERIAREMTIKAEQQMKMAEGEMRKAQLKAMEMMQAQIALEAQRKKK